MQLLNPTIISWDIEQLVSKIIAFLGALLV
jgi:hypothetical protein